jgi:lipid II:glycine glycyltransferase (peptidoglycan interpeptide bridge formation enzyme)
MDELSSFLHSPGWQRFQEAAGAVVEKKGNNLFIHRNLPQKGSYWISSRCYIQKNWEIPEFAKKSWFVRLEPDDHNSYENIIQSGKYSIRKSVSIQPKQTIFLDLHKSPDVLLSEMKSKHRYNIRLAEKHDVEVTIFSENLSDQFPRFWNLLQETADRHTFRTHDRSYYETMISTLEKEGMIKLGFASKDGVDLATILVIIHEKTATYLHGASSQTHKELMAPHLLHWRMISELHTTKLHWYDFWGINAQKTDEGWEAIPNHPSNGTTRFKLGFGGTIKEYPGCFDLVLQPVWYTLYTSIRGLRSRKRAFS